MKQINYMFTQKDGLIKFWTDDAELLERVYQNIKDIADAIHYRQWLKEKIFEQEGKNADSN